MVEHASDNERASSADLGRLERIAQAVAILSCVLLAVFTWSEVVARAARMRFSLASQFNGYLMAWLIFFTLPAVTRLRQHIAVDFLLVHMSAPLRQWLRLVGGILLVIYISLLIPLCWQLTLMNWDSGARAQGLLRTPVVYPQIGMMAGLGIMWIVAGLTALRDARALLTNRQAP